MDTDDVLHAIECLPDPLHPSTQIAKRVAVEIERLQRIIDSRPAINAGLPESYIKWSQSIYEMEAAHVRGCDSVGAETMAKMTIELTEKEIVEAVVIYLRGAKGIEVRREDVKVGAEKVWIGNGPNEMQVERAKITATCDS